LFFDLSAIFLPGDFYVLSRSSVCISLHFRFRAAGEPRMLPELLRHFLLLRLRLRLLRDGRLHLQRLPLLPRRRLLLREID